MAMAQRHTRRGCGGKREREREWREWREWMMSKVLWNSETNRRGFAAIGPPSSSRRAACASSMKWGIDILTSPEAGRKWNWDQVVRTKSIWGLTLSGPIHQPQAASHSLIPLVSAFLSSLAAAGAAAGAAAPAPAPPGTVPASRRTTWASSRRASSS